MQLNDIVLKIREYMILEESKGYIIDLLLATALSLEFDDPVWVFIVGKPSSGKTEFSKILNKLDNVHPIYNLTEKTLFSGHTLAQGGYLLREVKDKGIIIFPDFTTVLVDSKAKKKIFNQLRVIYDQNAGLITGMDTGKANIWKGKVVVIGLVTDAIEPEIESSSELGERFLYFKFNPKEITPLELSQFQKNNKAKNEVQDLVKKFLEEKKNELSVIKISNEEKENIYILAQVLSIGRAKVKRNSYREVEQIHTPEGNIRLNTALSNLYISLICVNKDRKRSFHILKKIIIDSIPSLRCQILESILSYKDEKAKFKFILSDINGISKGKVGRTIEDMILQGILRVEETGQKNSKVYSLTDNFYEKFKLFL